MSNQEDDIWIRLRKQDRSQTHNTRKLRRRTTKSQHVKSKPDSASISPASRAQKPAPSSKKRRQKLGTRRTRQQRYTKKHRQEETQPQTATSTPGMVVDTLLKKMATQKKPIALGAVTLVIVGGIGLGVYHATSGDRAADGNPQSLGISDVSEANLENIQPVDEVAFYPFYPQDFDERGVEFIKQQRGDTQYVMYADSLDGTNFTVTQQQATEEVVDGGVAQVENLAEALPIPAEDAIQVDETVVFVGTSDQNRQMLLFMKENVLIFIATEGLIAESSWAGYIASLINGT